MRLVTLVLGFAVLVLGGFWLVRTEVIPRLRPPAPLPKMWEVTDFKLTERSGGPLALSDLKGKVWVADLFYTTCPGPCPMLTSRLTEVQKALGSDAGARLVSVSSDPEKDTPEVLRQYAQRFGAGDRWFFLTGPKPEIYRFANEGLKLGVAEVPGTSEPITHATKLVLIDRQGWVRGFYDGVGGAGTKGLLRDIRRLEEEP